jgi:hypothetical protein
VGTATVFNPNSEQQSYEDAQLLSCIQIDLETTPWGTCGVYFEDEDNPVVGLDLQWRSAPQNPLSAFAQVMFFALGTHNAVSTLDASGAAIGPAVGAWEIQFNCSTAATACANGASLQWEGQLYTASQAILIGTDPSFPTIKPALNQFVFNNGRLYPPPGWLAATTTVLTLSASSVTSGTAVTFTAVVDEVRDASPTGTVTFRNGTTILGTQTLNSSGVAALTIPNLAVGTYNVIATYEGDKTAASSTSSSASLAVNAPPQPTVTLSVAPTTIQTGQTATLTWTSANATGCTASGAWTGSQAGSGTQSVTPSSAGAQSFAISCTGPGGTANASATLTVTAPPPPPSTSGSSGGGGGGGGSLSTWDLLAFGLLVGALADRRRRVQAKNLHAADRPALDTVPPLH